MSQDLGVGLVTCLGCVHDGVCFIQRKMDELVREGSQTNAFTAPGSGLFRALAGICRLYAPGEEQSRRGSFFILTGCRTDPEERKDLESILNAVRAGTPTPQMRVYRIPGTALPSVTLHTPGEEPINIPLVVVDP